MSGTGETSNQANVGQWSDRVSFSESGGFAYRPLELFVPSARAEETQELLELVARRLQRTIPRQVDEEVGGLTRFGDVVETLRMQDDLRARGIPAQPNHVLFSHCLCCCAPHPALSSGHPFSGNPFSGNPFSGNPFSGNPFSGNPFSGNPFSGNPFSGNPFSGNPFSGNPFSGNPFSDFQPNPLALLAYFSTRPEAIEFRATGRRPHSARLATAPLLPEPPVYPGDPSPSVVVIDTGIARGEFLPNALEGVISDPLPEQLATRQWSGDEEPDADEDGLIDPIAGHGTFIAGIIKGIAPACDLRVQGPLSGYGDVSEHDLAVVLEALLAEPPDLLNLSVGGYTAVDMVRLGGAVRRLQDAGTVVVASAGNDATCRPQYPAAFPGVVSVGALGPYGPAQFTNYGPWVRACAPGVDVISTFFTNWPPANHSGEKYAGWVSWSGTSFAAPAVVGALASAMHAGLTKEQAVARLIDDPGLFRIPGLGTVVNQTPWWQRAGGDGAQ
jgi:Subtilase family